MLGTSASNAPAPAWALLIMSRAPAHTSKACAMHSEPDAGSWCSAKASDVWPSIFRMRCLSSCSTRQHCRTSYVCSFSNHEANTDRPYHSGQCYALQQDLGLLLPLSSTGESQWGALNAWQLGNERQWHVTLQSQSPAASRSKFTTKSFPGVCTRKK